MHDDACAFRMNGIVVLLHMCCGTNFGRIVVDTRLILLICLFSNVVERHSYTPYELMHNRVKMLSKVWRNVLRSYDG